MSPTLYDGKLFIGASSSEETAAVQPGYVCCSFVGNMVALSFDGSNFKVVWNISMIPSFQISSGWSGVAVWGSQPSIDKSRAQVFVATGNTYSIPDVIIDCQNRTQNITAVEKGLVPDPCLPRDVWQNSVLAIDIELGIINWVQQVGSLDAFTLACGIAGSFPRNSGTCPQTPGEDVDFGMAPTFVPGSPSTPYGKDTLVIGQKSGNIYAMSAQSGYFFWSTAASPDGIAGGSSWGIAVDDNQVYFTAINSNYATWQLLPSNQTINRSAYGAASLKTGAIVWETAAPSDNVAYGPSSVVGDLVLVGRTGPDPTGNKSYDNGKGGLVGIEKRTGKIVLDHELDTSFHGGIAIQGSNLLFGSGYASFRPPTTPGTFYVVSVNSY